MEAQDFGFNFIFMEDGEMGKKMKKSPLNFDKTEEHEGAVIFNNFCNVDQ